MRTVENQRTKVVKSISAGTKKGVEAVSAPARLPRALSTDRPSFNYRPGIKDKTPIRTNTETHVHKQGVSRPETAPEQRWPEEEDPDVIDPPDPGGEDPDQGDPPGNNHSGDDDDDDHTIIIYNYGCHCPWWHNWCIGFSSPVYWSSWGYDSSYWISFQWFRKAKFGLSTYAYCDFSEYTPSIYIPLALAANEPNPEAIEHLDRGAEYFRAGRYIEAMHRFRMATVAAPEFAVCRFAYAHALFALGNYDYAAFEIRKGLEMMPEWIVAGGDLKKMYDDPDDFTDQLKALNSCLELWSGDENALLVIGYVAFFSGDLYGAEQAFLELSQSSFLENATAGNLFLDAIDEIKAKL
ncbi:MAG: tetratricopeptide repeat protein [Planctomycetota bacterium]